ncbi:hypothetical protein [Clavibacter sp. km1a]|uniref:hypothetical protein n=1 Tax=Clavibacter sp. km1a TaxID=3459136 RepID=UPI0040422A20
MSARAPGSDDDLAALPLDELRQRVFAQGADERDERWIRAAAELTRRERAASTAPEDAGDADDADDADEPATSSDESAAADATARRGRRPLAWAGAALAVGLLAGAGVATGLGAGSAAPSADPAPRASPAPTASVDPAPPDPATVRSLLGTEISGRSRGVALEDVLDRPQEQADSPPRSPRGDVDLSSIRGVQTSVGLYVARTISADVCLLVYPWSGSPQEDDSSPGSGVLSCVSPAQLAASDLHVTWVADAPLRAFDGSIVRAGIELTAALAPDGTITLAFPAGQLAY